MAVVGAALAGAGALLVPALGGGSPGSGDGASRAPSAAAPSARTGTPTSPPPTVEGTSRPPTLPALPAGARREAGLYAWVPPEDWQRVVRSDAKISYSSPDRAQEIIANAAPARGDLLRQWQDTERRSTGKGRDYRRIRLAETTFRNAPAVVWEYTVTADERPWHVRTLGFRSGGISYEIDTWYHPDAEARALPVYERVRDTFTPL
ncbi:MULTISPECIES: hypothetical protein [Streptomyces]|uniref:hypothetical protein n=1 Tax=Streptomyces TaxID=1883 RepID=UPI00167148A1|nr:hypothetical protein [Streptomyces ruber]